MNQAEPLRRRLRAHLGAEVRAPGGEWRLLPISSGPQDALRRLLAAGPPGRRWLALAAGEAAEYAQEVGGDAVSTSPLGAVVDGRGGTDVITAVIDALESGGALTLILVDEDGAEPVLTALGAGDATALAETALLVVLADAGDNRLVGAAGETASGLLVAALASAAVDPRPARRPALGRAASAAVAAVCVAALVVVALRSRPDGGSPAGSPSPSPAATATVALSSGPLHPGPAPEARSGPAAVWDATHHRLVLFGGTPRRDPTVELGDTWVWDGSGWQQQFPAHRPPARFGAVMASVPAGVMMIGGRHRLTAGDSGASSSLGDAWVWQGSDWSQVNPGPPLAAGDVPISLTPDPGAAASGGLVLLASSGGPGATVTVTWDGTAWHEEHPTTATPPIRVAAPDRAHARVLALAIGDGGTSTWAWAGHDWTELAPRHSAILDTLSAVLAADPSTGTVVLVEEHFSGVPTATDPTIDGGGTWVWDGADWTQVPGPVPEFIVAFDTTVPVSAEPSGRLTLLGGGFTGDAYRRVAVWDGAGHRWQGI